MLLFVLGCVCIETPARISFFLSQQHLLTVPPTPASKGATADSMKSVLFQLKGSKGTHLPSFLNLTLWHHLTAGTSLHVPFSFDHIHLVIPPPPRALLFQASCRSLLLKGRHCTLYTHSMWSCHVGLVGLQATWGRRPYRIHWHPQSTALCLVHSRHPVVEMEVMTLEY